MTPPRQAVELAALAKALYDMAANLDMVDSYNAEEAARTLLRQADTLAANAAEIDRLTKALGRISKPGYGIEMGDDDAARADYWAKVALSYRDIATAAIRAQQPSPAGNGGEDE
jgi:hypothetical protein